MAGITPLASEFILNDPSAGRQSDVVLAPLPAGGYVAVWIDSAGTPPMLRGRIVEPGETSASFQIAQAPTAFGEAQVAVQDNGDILVVWTQSDGNQADGPRHALVSRLYARGQDASGDPVYQAQPELVLSGSPARAVPGPGVLALTEGGFAVVAETEGRLSLWRLDAAGAVIDGPTDLAQAGSLTMVSAIAAAQDPASGALIILVQDDTDATAEIRALAVDPQSPQAVAPVTLSGTGRDLRPDVAALGDGRLVAVWAHTADPTDPATILGRFLDTDGQPQGDAFVIDDTGVSLTPRPRVTAPGVTELGGRGFLVAWDNGSGIAGQAFTAAGDPAGTRR